MLVALVLVVPLALVHPQNAAAYSGGTSSVAGGVVAWGNNSYGQAAVPASAESDIKSVAGGVAHTLALTDGGQVLAWGDNKDGDGKFAYQTSVPKGLSNVKAISAGHYHSLALKSDGSAVGWGYEENGLATVPADAKSGVTAIASGGWHNLALNSSGKVIAWGSNSNGQGQVPVAARSEVKAIAAGGTHNLALKTDGTVVAWGSLGQDTVPMDPPVEPAPPEDPPEPGDGDGEGEEPEPQEPQPTEMSDVKAIAAGEDHSLALRADGTVVAWDEKGEIDVPAAAKGAVAIAAGGSHSLALKSDGSVVAWGNNDYGQTSYPAGLAHVKAIAAGYVHSIAIRELQPWTQAPDPTIDGVTRVGSTLTAKTGSWNPTPTSFEYQWYRSGQAIDGATAASYKPVTDDAGKKITVKVTALKDGYQKVSRTSAATGEITGALIAPFPSIVGAARVGETLQASTGEWGPGAVSLTYQWYRGSNPISGATSPTYTLVDADAGYKMRVEVTGAKQSYDSVRRMSPETAEVMYGAVVSAVPTISGKTWVGETLTAEPGSWGPGDVTLSYRWFRSGAQIVTATGQEYVLVDADAGATITVQVTGTKPNYQSAQKMSSATAKVVFGKVTGPAPKITGTASSGSTLKAVPGKWGPAPVGLSYQWYRSGKKIANATKSSYKLTNSDAGKTIKVKVTGSRTNYEKTTKTSSATKKVVGKLTTKVPKITGKAKRGSTLKASPGKWGPGKVTLKYQWYRSGKKISKATKSSYKLVKADVGKTLKVKVTGSKTNYKKVTKTSKATKKIAR